MGGDNGGKRGRVFRNMYKEHMDKTKGRGGIRGGKCGGLGWGERRGVKADNCT